MRDPDDVKLHFGEEWAATTYGTNGLLISCCCCGWDMEERGDDLHYPPLEYESDKHNRECHRCRKMNG